MWSGKSDKKARWLIKEWDDWAGNDSWQCQSGVQVEGEEEEELIQYVDENILEVFHKIFKVVKINMS